MIKNFLKATLLCFILSASYTSFSQTDSILHETQDTLPPFRKISYDWVSYRMNLRVEQNKAENSFSLFFVNRIDSIIYLNFSKSGVEFVRIVLTPKEIIYVNKMDKNFYQGDYSFIRKIMGFSADFKMIQALFNAVDFDHFDNSLERYEDEEEGIQYIAIMRKKNLEDYSIMQEITVNDSVFIIGNAIQDIETGTHLDIRYKNYQKIDSFDFFDQISVNVNYDLLKASGQLKNIKFNTPGPTSIKIPEKFTPVQF